jgi:hypothetical protein
MNPVRLPHSMAVKKTNAKTTRSKKQHTPDYYPVQRKVPLGVFDSAISATTVGDAGRLLSIANRRLMRYGMNYQIKIDLEPNAAGIATPFAVDVYALANTWDVQRAFALSKKTYDEAHADELKVTGNGPARWRDFRVAADVTGAATLVPVRYDQQNQSAIVTNDGEFIDSTVSVGGVERRMSWSTASSSSINILSEWSVSGRASSDPSTVSGNAPYDGVNSDSADNIEMANLGEDGNNPPYNVTSHADLFVKVATIRYQPGAEGLQRLSTGYFDAPCGLFVLKHNLGGANLANGTISLCAKAGDYKGVDAKAMCN